MTQPTCATCSHFLAGAFGVSTYPADRKWEPALEGAGICRRYPPRYHLPSDESDGYSMFPSVHGTQVCGAYDPEGLII